MDFDPHQPDERQLQISAFYAKLGIPDRPAPLFDFGRILARLRAALKAGTAQSHTHAGTWSEPDHREATDSDAQQAGVTGQAPAPAPAQDAAGAAQTQPAPASLVLVHPAPAAEAKPGVPPAGAIPLPEIPGAEGGTVKAPVAEHAPAAPPRASFWTRFKQAHARRREQIGLRRERSFMRRFAGLSFKAAGYCVMLIYGVGNLTEPLAASYFGGKTSVADVLAPDAGIMILGSGTRPVFARPPSADPSDPSRAHLPEAARASQNFGKITYIATALEDRRALEPALSVAGLMRVHGTDTLAIGKAVWTFVVGAFVPGTKRRGGSTVPVTTCSIAIGTMEMPDGVFSKIKAKIDEHVCAARLEAETGGDAAVQAGMLLDNAALVIGGGADTQGVTLASWQLFSQDFAAIPEDCHLAVMAAAINLPFLVPGDSPASQEAARTRLEALIQRARAGLEMLRERDGQGLSAADMACLAALPALLDRRFRNPAGAMNRTFGAAAPQIAAEAFEFRDRHPGTVQLTARFDPAANEAAIQRVGDAACRISRRRALRLNICADDGLIDRAQIRVIAVEPSGAVHRMVALGAGAGSALRENEEGELPGRGSVTKGILLPVLAENLFCRFDYPDIEDADGVKGVDHACRPDELVSAAYAVRASLNQPFVYALSHTNQDRLGQYRDALGLHRRDLRDLVLGNRPAATQILLRDYLAVTSLARTAAMPHFFVEAGGPSVDLSGMISADDVARTRLLLAEPAKPGGTTHAAAMRLQASGYTVVWSKSGTSESGLFTDERGKHLIAELRDPKGRPLVVFAEIASADSSAIGGSKALSSADLAEIILATLNPET